MLNPKNNVAGLNFVSKGFKIAKTKWPPIFLVLHYIFKLQSRSQHNFACDVWQHDCFYEFGGAEFKNECCQAEFSDLGVQNWEKQNGRQILAFSTPVPNCNMNCL